MNSAKMKDFFAQIVRGCKGEKDQGSIKQKNEAKIKIKFKKLIL